MKSLRIALLIGICFIGVHFQNCCNCPEINEFFDIQDMVVTYNLSDSPIPLETDTTILFSELLNFQTDFIVQYISDIDHNSSDRFKFTGFSTMPQAYGCDCAQLGDSGSKNERLENISIITTRPFNSEFGAFDTISSLFTISPELQPQRSIDLDTYLGQELDLIQQEFLALQLAEAPEIDSVFQAIFSIELSTGEVYNSLSPLIQFR